MTAYPSKPNDEPGVDWFCAGRHSCKNRVWFERGTKFPTTRLGNRKVQQALVCVAGARNVERLIKFYLGRRPKLLRPESLQRCERYGL